MSLIKLLVTTAYYPARVLKLCTVDYIVMRMRENWAHDFRCPTHTSRDFLCHAHSFPCAKSEVPFLPNDPKLVLTGQCAAAAVSLPTGSKSIAE